VGAGGTFSFSVAANGGTPTHHDIVVGADATECTGVFSTKHNNAFTPVDQVVITEGALPSADWALTAIDTKQLLFTGLTYDAPRLDDSENLAGGSATVFINNDMARRVTFTNTFTPPPTTTGCTYTKGWYQNKNGAPTVIAVDGRSIVEAQTIFAATPGKPNGVTLSGTSNTNLLLNVYQQLLAALNNLGGDANAMDGPPDVDAAIALAQSGTGGAGLNITTTLTVGQLGSLATTLANFNEGEFEGWPHCED
jgi:hypothetical protein